MLELIQKQLKETIKTQFCIDTNVSIEIPPMKEFGDYSSNIAMRIANQLGKSPIDVANALKDSFKDAGFLKKIDIVKPGFINFYINDSFLVKKTLDAIYSGTLLPSSITLGKVIVEHTSVNPNKAMHVGHIRNALLGDSIARLLRRVGYKVEVHNYIDDTGVQVADTVNGLLSTNLEQSKDQKFDDFCWDVYTQINKAYETNPELLENRKKILHEVETGSSEISEMVKEVVDKILDCHLDLMTSFNIKYDLLVYERDIMGFGFWDVAFEQLKKSPNFVFVDEGKQKGCWVLKYDDPKFEDKIFVRADGTKVYTAKDTAYHLWKFGLLNKDFLYRKWSLTNSIDNTWRTSANGEENTTFGHADRIINVIDERQSYPQEMVKHALHSLGFVKASESYNHVAYGVVSLSKDTATKLGIDTSDGKDAYAMSGRKGIGVKVTDLVALLENEISNLAKNANASTNAVHKANSKDIAIGAIKHYMLKNNPNSEVLFDFEQALQLVGNTGPYLQYSHARASSLLRSAGEFNLTFISPETLSETERVLVNKLAEFPNVVAVTLKDFNMSQLSNYAFEVSKSFHSFYENNNVLKSSEDVKSFRLTLVKAYTLVIADVLNILGIVAPDQM